MNSRAETSALLVDFIQALRAGDIKQLESLLDEECPYLGGGKYTGEKNESS